MNEGLGTLFFLVLVGLAFIVGNIALTKSEQQFYRQLNQCQKTCAPDIVEGVIKGKCLCDRSKYFK